MKKILAILAGVILSAPAFAQLMTDGTVQIVAYWDKGDVMNYQSVERDERTDEEGKTTLIKSNSEVVVITVAEKTDSTYTILRDDKDGYYSDTRVQSYMDIVNSLGKTSPIKLITDNMGSLQRIDNMDILIKETKAMIPKLVDALIKQYPKEMRKELDRKGMIDALLSTTATPEAITNACKQDISELLAYHGARLDTNRVYSGTTEMSLGVGDPVPAEIEFWVDSAETDATFAVLRSHTYVSMENLKPVLKEIAIKTVTSMAKDVSESDVADAFKGELTGSFDEYTVLVVHLASGWPVQYGYEKDVVITKDGKTTQSTVTRTLDLITENN